MSQVVTLNRHYGLDWLRIAAFGLMIVYHVAMVFSPTSWVVKWPETYPALIGPLALMTPWRIPLLFLVSGFATRRLLARTPDLPTFVKGRSARLLVPLAFAVVVLLPAELWVRVRLAGAPDSLMRYWFGHYWSPVAYYGRAFPNWEHMWFVVYLWAYTMLLAGLVALVGAARVQSWFDRLTIGLRLVWFPVAGLVMAKLSLMFLVPEKQGLLIDWTGHVFFAPVLMFGFALGGSTTLWGAIGRVWRPALALSAVCAVIVLWIELSHPDTMPGHALMALNRAARLGLGWGVMIALLRFADVRLNHDHPSRRTLAEAVFPAYLIHHPVLVVLAWLAPTWGLGAGAGFVFLLSATFASCLAVYLIGREIAWLRPLIGLAPRHATGPGAGGGTGPALGVTVSGASRSC